MAETKPRFSLIKYLKNSYVELKKVSWPTRQETMKSTIVVILFSVVLAAFLGLIDYGFTEGFSYLLTLKH